MVYCMNRFRLGCLAKMKGQSVSAIGIMNYQGANDEFRDLIEIVDALRE